MTIIHTGVRNGQSVVKVHFHPYSISDRNWPNSDQMRQLAVCGPGKGWRLLKMAGKVRWWDYWWWGSFHRYRKCQQNIILWARSLNSLMIANLIIFIYVLSIWLLWLMWLLELPRVPVYLWIICGCYIYVVGKNNKIYLKNVFDNKIFILTTSFHTHWSIQ